MPTPRLFHYTTGENLRQILSDGFIKQATKGVDTTVERPVVWFTYGEEWEQTANKAFKNVITGEFTAANEADTEKKCGGLFRIEVDPATAPYDFEFWKRNSGVSAEMANVMPITAAQMGGSSHKRWRVSFEKVPISKFLMIEMRTDGEWKVAEWKATGDVATIRASEYSAEKVSATNPANNRAVPSRIEDLIKGVADVPIPDEESFLGPKPDPDGVLHEGLFNRAQIVEEAQRLDSRVVGAKCVRIADAIFNNGLSYDKIKNISSMSGTPESLAAIQQILEDASLDHLVAGKDDVLAVVATARAIVNHTNKHHGGAYQGITVASKTPFMAWRVKETIAEYLLKAGDPILVDPTGYYNKKQASQFYANFNAADLVLWNNKIWREAIRGCEKFEGTTLEPEMIDTVTPQFWQFDTPMAIDSRHGEFKINQKDYDCVGFTLMPTVEEFFRESVADAAVNIITGAKPTAAQIAQAEKMIAGAPKFARRGIAISILFLPISGDPTPEVRFMSTILEGELIKGGLQSVLLSGVKFLGLPYVAQDTVGVSKKELKQDRGLFKKVRHGKVQIPPIKIINLRRAEVQHVKAPANGNGSNKRHLTCHFLRDAHWRRQWYASLGIHKAIRIEAQLVGDTTKPFKPSREKVYKAIR